MQVLKEIQQNLQNYILLRDKTIANQIELPNKGEALQRLDIYADGYILRIVEAMALDFPVLARVVGEQVFAELVENYLQAFPPKTTSISFVGEFFSQYLSEISHYTDHLFLAELANFEWQLLIADLYRAETYFSLTELQKVSPTALEQYIFKLTTSMHLIELNFNVISIWNAIDQEQTLPTITQKTTETYAIWQDHQAQIKSLRLSELQKRILELLKTNYTFELLCATLTEDAEFPEDIEVQQIITCLIEFVQLGMIVS